MSHKFERGAAEVIRWSMAGVVVFALSNVELAGGIFQYIGAALGALTWLLVAILFSMYVVQPLDPDTPVQWSGGE